jgi:hypothetical protein
MAETKVINLEVKDNSEETADGFKKVADSIEDVNEGVKDTNKGVDEVGKTADTVTGGMVGKFRGLLGSVKSVISSFGVLKTAIIATGIGALLVAIVAVKNAFTSSEEGQNKFAKILGVIGAVVGNLLDILSDLGMKIISIFEDPKKAIKDFAKLIKENIVNRFNGLLELIPALGKAVSALFKGNFSEAGKIATNATAKVTLGVENLTDKIQAATEATKAFIEEQIREAKIAAEIADQRAKADKLERSLIVQRAEANRKRAELLEKAQQRQNFTVKERIEFLKQASELEEEITNKEIKAAKLRRDAIIEENKLSKSNKEALQAEEEAKAKVIELETARLSKQKEVTGQISGLIEQEKALNKAKFDENKRLINEKAAKEKQANEESLKLAKEKAQKELEIERNRIQNLQNLENDFLTQLEQAETDYYNSKLTAEQLEIQNTQDKFFNLIEQAKQFGQDTSILEQAQKDELSKINDKYREAEIKKDKDLQEQKYDAVKSTLSSISNLAELFAGKSKKQQEKAFKVQKAANIASATIDTYKGAVSVFAQTPGGLLIKSLAAAGAVTAGLANVKKIASQKFDGGGNPSDGGSRPNIPNLSTPQSVQPSFNIVGDSGVNELEALKSQPSKAYVVSGEVTTQQALDRNRQRNATL